MLEYHQLYRAGRPGLWWLGFLGIPVAVGFLFVGSAIVIVPIMVWAVLSGRAPDATLEEIVNLDDPTPLALAYLNLSIAIVIPMVFGLVWLMHGLRPGWLTSVRPRMRWIWFVVCLGLSVVALVATVFVAALMPAPEATPVTGELNSMTRTVFEFALVILLLTPFQAAGEEYLFRGYLTQAIGSFFPARAAIWLSRAVAVVVPALLFALMHGLGQSPPVFFDRLAFGIVAGILVIATGGLEAAIAMHVLNNFLAFGLSLAFSDIGSALNPGEASWAILPSTLTQSLVYLGLAMWVGRAMGLSNRAPLEPVG